MKELYYLINIERFRLSYCDIILLDIYLAVSYTIVRKRLLKDWHDFINIGRFDTQYKSYYDAIDTVSGFMLLMACEVMETLIIAAIDVI